MLQVGSLIADCLEDLKCTKQQL